MSIVTDMAGIDEPKNKNTPLFHLYCLFANKEEKKILTNRYDTPGLRYGDIKVELYEKMMDYFLPYREKRASLLSNPDEVTDILKMGAKKAKVIASEVLERILKCYRIEISSMTYNIQLEKFEGPLDLLLYFIRRDELDIYDIPISKITEDFIETINEWKRLNMLIAGEFIVMASSLMRIKARMMIPRVELDEDDDIIDPRTELMQQLIDYKRFRNAADLLNNMAEERSQYYTRKLDMQIKDDEDENLDSFFKDVSLFDLAKLFKNAMDSRPVLSPFELNKEPIKLEQQKELILGYFDGDGKLSFNNLLGILRSRMEIIVTFLAILDLVKEGTCTVHQANVFSDIHLVNLTLQS